MMKLLRILLFPFAIIYDIVTAIRNVLFDLGLLKSNSFKTPTIVVGNLSVGGTGKTPQIEYLIKLLKTRYSIGVLSRGYGRASKGFILAETRHTASDIGDEPLQFYNKFDDLTVAVDEQRVRGIQNLEQLNTAPEVILLDDAFQHRKVKAGFSILLTKFDALFPNDFLLPTGNLRERRAGAKRADVLIVTKCPEEIETIHQDEIAFLLRRYFKGPIFFTTIQYSSILKSNTTAEITTESLVDYEVLLVTGIANPKPLLAHLSKLNCVFTHENFPDHHQFSTSEVLDLKKKFDTMKSLKKIILTTEKDFVRLTHQIDALYYLEIETKFVAKQSEFDQLIQNYIKPSL